MTQDSKNCFERVHRAMLTLCGPGTLEERLASANLSIIPLPTDAFPTVKLRETFRRFMDQNLKATQSNEKQVENVALILSLYTQAAKLDGFRQNNFD